MVSLSPGIWVRRRRLHGRDGIGGRKGLFQALLKRTLEDVQGRTSPPCDGGIDLFWFHRLSVRHHVSQNK